MKSRSGPRKAASTDIQGEINTFEVHAIDCARLTEPGTLAIALVLEDCDPTDALMVELPISVYAKGRESLERLVQEKLHRTLLVILTPDVVEG